MTETSVGDWLAGLYRREEHDARSVGKVGHPSAAPSPGIAHRPMDSPFSSTRPAGPSTDQRALAVFDRDEHTGLRRFNIVAISKGTVRG